MFDGISLKINIGSQINRTKKKVIMKTKPATILEYQSGKVSSEDFSSRKKVQHGLDISRIPQDLAVKICISVEQNSDMMDNFC